MSEIAFLYLICISMKNREIFGLIRNDIITFIDHVFEISTVSIKILFVSLNYSMYSNKFIENCLNELHIFSTRFSQFCKGQFPISETDVFITSKPCNRFLGDRDKS